MTSRKVRRDGRLISDNPPRLRHIGGGLVGHSGITHSAFVIPICLALLQPRCVTAQAGGDHVIEGVLTVTTSHHHDAKRAESTQFIVTTDRGERLVVQFNADLPIDPNRLDQQRIRLLSNDLQPRDRAFHRSGTRLPVIRATAVKFKPLRDPPPTVPKSPASSLAADIGAIQAVPDFPRVVIIASR
jgi:hypothetical protein